MSPIALIKFRQSMQDERRMSMVEHLDELRRRLFWILACLGSGTALGWMFRSPLRHFLQAPLGSYPLVYLKPTEAFLVNLKLAFALGVLLTLPVFFYHTLSFCLPGLGAKLQRRIWTASALGSALFLTGAGFGVRVVLPPLMRFLLSFADPSLSPQISVDYYMTFVFGMALVFGLSFELPLLMWMLGSLGLVSAKFLRQNRRYAILFNCIAAAILTPPDVLSQMLLFIPLLILYELGIWLVVWGEK
jgi:sec-independent protein translocase protein TatC